MGGGSFSVVQKKLTGQALKVLFAMKKYIHKFVNLTPEHICDIFDKMITPICN